MFIPSMQNDGGCPNFCKLFLKLFPVCLPLLNGVFIAVPIDVSSCFIFAETPWASGTHCNPVLLKQLGLCREVPMKCFDCGSAMVTRTTFSKYESQRLLPMDTLKTSS